MKILFFILIISFGALADQPKEESKGRAFLHKLGIAMQAASEGMQRNVVRCVSRQVGDKIITECHR